MERPRISAIAAIAENRVIGKDNDLIWKLPKDHKRFVALTTGHPLVMGRKTHESIGRPLPNRTNIVITRDLEYSRPGIIVVHSLQEALAKAKEFDQEEIFINGGGQIYQEALPFTDRLYLTIVHTDAEGDTFFPEYEKEFTKVAFKEEIEENGLKYTFLDLERE
jgi:dihydrofolate reductase